MTQDDSLLAAKRRRVLYRAEHRGTKEMDWLLGRFAQHSVPGMDVATLDQFEALLETLQKRHRLSATSGNFAVYLLRNADAGDVAQTLTQLFRPSSRSSSSSRLVTTSRWSTKDSMI